MNHIFVELLIFMNEGKCFAIKGHTNFLWVTLPRYIYFVLIKFLELELGLGYVFLVISASLALPDKSFINNISKIDILMFIQYFALPSN